MLFYYSLLKSEYAFRKLAVLLVFFKMIIPHSEFFQRAVIKGFLIIFYKLLFIRGFKRFLVLPCSNPVLCLINLSPYPRDVFRHFLRFQLRETFRLPVHKFLRLHIRLVRLRDTKSNFGQSVVHENGIQFSLLRFEQNFLL